MTFTEEDFQEAQEGERKLELLSRGCTHLPGGKSVITHEYDSVIYLDRVMRIAKRIRFFRGDVCKMVAGWRKARIVRLNRLGHSLLLICRQYRAVITVGIGKDECPRFGHHKYHPYLDVALKAVAEAEASINEALGNKDHERLCTAVSNLAVEIHIQTNTEVFKASVRNFERNAEAKLRRALSYLVSLFGKRSRLLVLRVDLYVREKDRLWSYTPEAEAAFDKFASALSGCKIVPDVLGWMSAREDGLERGRHYHVMALLDGHERRAGVNLAKTLGEYWMTECVGSDRVGSYFNCFALAKKYKHLGIGTIHCSDAKKLLGLFYATRYLCKSNVQLVATGEGSRNFRRGVVDKSYVRRGAPRVGDDGLSTVKQALFGQMRRVAARKRSVDESRIQLDATDGHALSPWL